MTGRWPRIAAITATTERRGRRRDARAVDGILLLDKPPGLSSNAALQQARRLFRAQKAGHTGSLDPLATGLLPVCFGEATKLSGYLLDSDKRYRGVAQLGARTSTGDAEGEIVERAAVPALSVAAIEAVFQRQLGPQLQRPPMYSALKQGGQRLYALARQGIEVEREPRAIVIHGLRLLGYADGQLEFEVSCSKGTYIRSLVEDLGAALGSCAHLRALRRLAAGPFSGPLHGLDQLAALAAQDPAALDACLLPPASALAGWPQLTLDRDTAFYLRRGEAVRVPKAPREGLVALFDRDHALLGIGRITEAGLVAPQRLLNAPAPSA